jgi:predicted nucleotidyltransferase
MVLKLERFNLEYLGTRNTVKIMRTLTTKPYLSWGLTELSVEIGVSKSNILRIMKVLTKYNLVIEQKSGRKKVYRINYQIKSVQILWKLYMEEKRQNIPPNFKNVLDLIYHQIKDDVELFILFGSVARGLETEKSDIDLCIIPKNKVNIQRFDFLPYRFEIHEYDWHDFENPLDLVVLEALFQGIVFKGDIFPIIAQTNSFPKSYLIYRLEKAKEFLNKSKALKGEAKEYYNQIAERGETHS